MTLGLSAGKTTVKFYLKNVGDAPADVLSHVNAGDEHLDWYSLRMENEKGETRTLRFFESRDKSGSVKAHLEPGESLHHSVDVAGWAVRPVNGAEPLAGTYEVYAVYEVSPPGDNWSGRLEAGPVTMTI